MKGNKYRPKPIKRHDHTGAMVNYGTLEVGIVAGIRCLGSKETLLLIGAGLAKQKVPDYFYTQHYIRVPVSSQLELKVYAVKATDASGLAKRLSTRSQLKKAELIFASQGRTEELYENGVKVETESAPVMRREPMHFTTKVRRVSKLRRLWLLIKRLFSNQGVES